MAGELVMIPLGELADSRPGSIAIGPFGSKMKTDCYVENGVPVIRGTNISDSRAWKGEWVYISDDFADTMPNCIATSGDLVFPHRGSIGEVALIPNDNQRYMISTSLMKFRPDPNKADPAFLFYYFRSSTGRQEILKYSSQVGTPGIGQPLTSLRQFKVPKLLLKDQQAIAEVLSALDDQIELNRWMNETLEGIARSLFKDWFIDFGPVKTKVSGQQPPGLDADIADLFPDSLSEGGIPVGWQWSTIGQEVSIYGGGTPSTKEPAYWEGGSLFWATPKDLSKLNSPILLDTERKITQEGMQKISSGQLPKGTVLLSSRAPIGYLAISDVPISINQGFIAIVCNKQVTNLFAYLWCKANMERILNNANGSTFQEISKANFRPIPLLRPPDKLLAAFDEVSRSLYLRIATNQHETNLLTEIRDTLLPKLISGEVSVQDAERQVEEAM